MSNYFSYQKGEYVCVDSSPERGRGSSGPNHDRYGNFREMHAIRLIPFMTVGQSGGILLR